jgi:hypothetical protein
MRHRITAIRSVRQFGGVLATSLRRVRAPDADEMLRFSVFGGIEEPYRAICSSALSQPAFCQLTEIPGTDSRPKSVPISLIGVRRDKAALSSGCKSQEQPARLQI